MSGLWHPHYLAILIFLSLGLLTALANALTVRRFDQYPATKDIPRVSVLVPARNEARNVEACVRSLFLLIALRSMALSLTGNATWKNRVLDRAAVRWF